MALLSLVIELGADEANRLSDALLDAGALSISAEDPLAGTAAEVPIYDEPDWNNASDPAGWTRLRLRVLVDETRLSGFSNAQTLLASAAHAAGIAFPDFVAESVDDEDWVRKTQAQFEPIRISQRLWIVPSWHAEPDPTAVNIALDPGVAFGTGSHPTTKLCLRWLESKVRGGETVLDYGCGSGILGIAASRLGAGRVVGLDIDPAAVISAQENAVRNHVIAEFMNAGTALELSADLVVANILANPLKVLAPLLASYARAGGHIALSGILAPQAAEVMAIYSPWFAFEPAVEEDGWVCLSGQRNSSR